MLRTFGATPSKASYGTLLIAAIEKGEDHPAKLKAKTDPDNNTLKLFNMYIYRLRSINNPEKVYTGITSHLNRRFYQHNSGANRHTSFGRPWKIEWAIWIKDRNIAYKLEKYLKFHSGRAFIKKHL